MQRKQKQINRSFHTPKRAKGIAKKESKALKVMKKHQLAEVV